MSDEMSKLRGVFHVTLGGVEHEVRVKTIKETVDFRRTVGPLLVPFAEKIGPMRDRVAAGGNAEGAFLEALPGLLPYLIGECLDLLANLPEQYEPSLAEACAGASDEELIEAGTEVLAKVFPLLFGVVNAVPNLIRAAKGGV